MDPNDLYTDQQYTDINIQLHCCGVTISRMLFEQQLSRCKLCPFVKCMTNYCAQHKKGALLRMELIDQLTPFTLNVYMNCCRRYINKAKSLKYGDQREVVIDLMAKLTLTRHMSRRIVAMPCYCQRRVDLWDIQEKILRARVLSSTGCRPCKSESVQPELLVLFEPIVRLHYNTLWLQTFNQLNSNVVFN